MRVSTLERRVEREFLRLGKQLAQPAYDRINELVERLKVYFPITGLRMGMGTYLLLGEPVEVFYDDGSMGSVEMSELFDYFDGKIWKPQRLTQRNEKMLRELRDWLDWLTDMPYVPLHQFGKEP